TQLERENRRQVLALQQYAPPDTFRELPDLIQRRRRRQHLKDAGVERAGKHCVTVHRVLSSRDDPAASDGKEEGKRKPLPPRLAGGGVSSLPNRLATPGAHPTRPGNHHNCDGGSALHLERCARHARLSHPPSQPRGQAQGWPELKQPSGTNDPRSAGTQPSSKPLVPNKVWRSVDGPFAPVQEPEGQF